MSYPRDLIGHGPRPPHADWPGGARLALQIVMNWEEGGERSILHGDEFAETYLHEVPGTAPLAGVRNLQIESTYEYGTRAGLWRLLRLFRERAVPISVFAVGMAVERYPEAARAIVDAGHEVVSHGWRWIDYQFVSEEVEREHIRRAVASIERAAGARPLGWYTGRLSPSTRRLVVEEGGFLYDADAYNDDLPYWVEVAGRPHGFSTGDEFFTYLRDAFDVLYAEGGDRPKMMSVGLHMRLVGRPGRIGALARFLDHVQRHDAVWICRRLDIARHWIARHPHGR
jgi:peptidoglycan/xylan/chitin deacetylase (PgdA/CDA1 family)